ncbi:MAG TPA: hypothetical protein VK619_14915, partial [Pyrinomonadaceae bacterium]|nr:hypothetical protein [Pyrinomonadaceae bacterium]
CGNFDTSTRHDAPAVTGTLHSQLFVRETRPSPFLIAVECPVPSHAVKRRILSSALSENSLDQAD